MKTQFFIFFALLGFFLLSSVETATAQSRSYKTSYHKGGKYGHDSHYGKKTYHKPYRKPHCKPYRKPHCKPYYKKPYCKPYRKPVHKPYYKKPHYNNGHRKYPVRKASYRN